MKTNVAKSHPVPLTAEGAPAFAHTNPTQMLRRSVMSCMLWEGEFYQDGQSIYEQIKAAAYAVPVDLLAKVAIEVRTVHNLRHVSLLLLVFLADRARNRPDKLVSNTIFAVIQRADELAEFLSLYWKLNPREGKDSAGRANNAPLSKQVKDGLARAFGKFNEYSLAKYNRESEVKLRDVMFLVHPKPRDQEHADLYKRVASDTLQTPDTWEVELSGGKDKKETFTRLINEGKLGYLALLRNLRNMASSGVEMSLVKEAVLARRGGAERVLPFRYVAAARACPQLEREVDTALQAAIAELPELPGKTVVLVDVSGSMDVKLSGKSDLTRVDAAAALASLIKAESLRVFSFSNACVEVPPRRGMAGVDAIQKSQGHGGTDMFRAIDFINKNVPYDRLIVISDEQAHPTLAKGMPEPKTRGYMINVASYQNGVGYGKWVHIDGFSENVIKWIHEYEKAGTE